MGQIIDLKKIVLDYRPGDLRPKYQNLRYHALEVLNYIEKCENFVVNPKEKVYNGINYGDLAVIKNENT